MHWECEKHAFMLGYLCKTILREEGVTRLNMEKLEIKRLSSTFVGKECLSSKFMKTSWKPLERSLLLVAQRQNGQQSSRLGE